MLVIVMERFTVPPGVVVALLLENVRAAGAGSALAAGARPNRAEDEGEDGGEAEAALQR
ncbi:hypothetical protein GCM10020254_16870 [Streptomyces goshikiensis]